MKITLLKSSFLGKVQQNLLERRIKDSILKSSYEWTDNTIEAEILLFCDFFPSEINEVLPYSYFIRSCWEDLYNNSLEVIEKEEKMFFKEAKFFLPSHSKKKSFNIIALLEGLKDPIETFIVSLALEKEAIKRGWYLKIYKKENFVHSFDLINREDLDNADFILTSVKEKDISLLKGKKVYLTKNKRILKSPSSEMDKMLNNFKIVDNLDIACSYSPKKRIQRIQDNLSRTLLTGFYFSLPMVIMGAFFTILSYISSYILSDNFVSYFLNYIGVSIIPLFTIPLLSASIAFYISDRRAIFAGALGGFLANEFGSGFIGGIVAGFLAGFLVQFLLKKVPLYGTLGILNSFFLIPFFSSIFLCSIFTFLVIPPFYYSVNFISETMSFLKKLHPFILGAFLGALTASDLGGVMTKSSYAFGLSLLALGEFLPLVSIVIGGMIPPIAMGIITWMDYLLGGKKYSSLDRRAGIISFISGVFSITEGVLPIAIKDLSRSILSSMLGAAIGGGLFMVFCSFLGENNINNLSLFSLSSLLYFLYFTLCIILGTVSTIIFFYFLKPRLLGNSSI